MSGEYVDGFKQGAIIAAVVGAMVGFVIGSITQRYARDDYWRHQAVKYGKAAFTLRDDRVEWNWKP